MAAGLSRKQRNQRMYNHLKTLQGKLERAGVPSVYDRFQLCADTTGMTHINGFNVKYSWSSASNGESAGFIYITVFYDGATEKYGWLQPKGDFDKGLDRVVELFSRTDPEFRIWKPYTVHVGKKVRKFDTLDAARQFCNEVHRETGTILSITQ